MKNKKKTIKKSKIISIRVSQDEYRLLYNDYIHYKSQKYLTKWLYKKEIITFTDYIRLMIEKGLND